jgi:hypothetical protein
MTIDLEHRCSRASTRVQRDVAGTAASPPPPRGFEAADAAKDEEEAAGRPFPRGWVWCDEDGVEVCAHWTDVDDDEGEEEEEEEIGPAPVTVAVSAAAVVVAGFVVTTTAQSARTCSPCSSRSGVKPDATGGGRGYRHPAITERRREGGEGGGFFLVLLFLLPPVLRLSPRALPLPSLGWLAPVVVAAASGPTSLVLLLLALLSPRWNHDVDTMVAFSSSSQKH